MFQRTICVNIYVLSLYCAKIDIQTAAHRSQYINEVTGTYFFHHYLNKVDPYCTEL